MQESLHGGVWQIAAFVMRLLFLVLVMPFLPPGELAEYVFITSIAVLVAKFLVLGLDDEIPLLVRANYQRARQLFPMVLIAWLLLPGVLGASYATGHWATYACLLGLFGATGAYLSGIVRTISPADFERLQNLPWILFGLFALSGRLSTAEEFIVLRSLCALGAQVLIILKQKLFGLPSLGSLPRLLTQLKESVTKGWIKLVSNLTLVGTMRGFILWPAILSIGPALDTVAFAVACGEALWQLGMVYAHRRYAHFSSADASESGSGTSVIASAIVLAVSLSCGVLIVIVGAELAGIFPDGQSSRLVGQAGVFYVLLSGFCLLRFLLWSVRRFEWAVIGIQFALIIAQGAIVLLLAPDMWFVAASVASVFSMFLVAGLVLSALGASEPDAGSTT